MTPKKGDRIKCITARRYSILKNGKVYIFERINSIGNFVVSDNGKIIPGGFFPKRFELIADCTRVARRLLR